MGPKELKELCALDDGTTELLKTAMADWNLSARAYDRILKVARTIADLKTSPAITYRKQFSIAHWTGRFWGKEAFGTYFGSDGFMTLGLGTVPDCAAAYRWRTELLPPEISLRRRTGSRFAHQSCCGRASAEE